MAHTPSFPESPETVSAELLVLQACDDVDSLHVVQRAYACLEKLIGPQHPCDTEEVYPSRTELSALVGLVNEELQRRIETADATIQSLRVALSEGGAQRRLSTSLTLSHAIQRHLMTRKMNCCRLASRTDWHRHLRLGWSTTNGRASNWNLTPDFFLKLTGSKPVVLTL